MFAVFGRSRESSTSVAGFACHCEMLELVDFAQTRAGLAGTKFGECHRENVI
jgi:hypothetical protein